MKYGEVRNDAAAMNLKKSCAALTFVAMAVLAIFAVGCSSHDAGGPPAESSATNTASITVADSPGHALFIAKGCAACHGQNGEGTTIAPALPSHNEAIVINQVRNPRFQMPAFSPSQVSNEELEAIAGFIANLEGNGHEHSASLEEPGEQTASVEMHHWMALESLEAHDPVEAIHHAGHIIELLGPGLHQDRMQEILESLESGGDSHGSKHQIEEMLAVFVALDSAGGPPASEMRTRAWCPSWPWETRPKSGMTRTNSAGCSCEICWKGEGPMDSPWPG